MYSMLLQGSNGPTILGFKCTRRLRTNLKQPKTLSNFSSLIPRMQASTRALLFSWRLSQIWLNSTMGIAQNRLWLHVIIKAFVCQLYLIGINSVTWSQSICLNTSGAYHINYIGQELDNKFELACVLRKRPLQ